VPPLPCKNKGSAVAKLQHEHRDRPFSGHWRAPDIVSKLGLPPARTEKLATAREAVIADAIIASMRGQKVSYSRRSVWYPRVRRYLDQSCSFATIPPTVDELAELGVILSYQVKPGSNRRIQSTFEASPVLVDCPVQIEHRQREPIWLRDSEKKFAPYDDTRETVLLRRLMNEINEGSKQIRIEVPDARRHGPFLVVAGEKGDTHILPRPDNGMVRIFNNGSFAHGGRMFGWHHGIPKGARRTMTINGELIAEADFAAMHISILYIEAGLRLDGDAYDVGAAYHAGDPELTRNHVKRAVNTMLNAANRSQAAWALKTELAITLTQTHKLIEAVERRHARISRHFFTGIGMQMMRIESDIMTEVVRNLLAAGIPVLPVHDAALVQVRHYDLVEAEMYAAFERRTGVAGTTVRRKG
jgi:hypothetical protein